MDLIFVERLETEASQKHWAKAQARVQAEVQRIRAQINLQRSGVSAGGPLPQQPPQYTQEEVASRDFSEGHQVAIFRNTGLNENVPNMREMVTLDKTTYIIINREFMYQYSAFSNAMMLEKIYFEVLALDGPPVEDMELRAYGKNPPISQLKLVESEKL